ncbi:MAG: hypothetical protein LBV08_09020, partial [Clostridiales bacterium]|nr:hypothetical protein [Clostridiales bacterium]
NSPITFFFSGLSFLLIIKSLHFLFYHGRILFTEKFLHGQNKPEIPPYRVEFSAYLILSKAFGLAFYFLVAKHCV